MKKLIASLLVSAVACLYAGYGFSQLQTPSSNAGQPPIPQNGFATVDGNWLVGLASGLNFTTKFGLNALGTNQATATQLGSTNHFLQEIDSVSSGTGVAMPPCFAGTALVVSNNGSNTLTVYPTILNNTRTLAQDTFNGGGTSVSIAVSSTTIFLCAKNGNWFTK